MVEEELRDALKTLSQDQRDILDCLIIAGEKSLGIGDYLALKQFKRLGLVAQYSSGRHQYCATKLSDYFKFRVEKNFE